MRILEAFVLIISGFGLFRIVFPSLRKIIPTPAYEVSAILVASIHIMVEGYRWQMVPAYALMLSLVILGWILSRSEAPLPSMGTGSEEAEASKGGMREGNERL